MKLSVVSTMYYSQSYLRVEGLWMNTGFDQASLGDQEDRPQRHVHLHALYENRVVQRLVTNVPVSGWASPSFPSGFSAGLIILILGVNSTSLAAIFVETKQ